MKTITLITVLTFFSSVLSGCDNWSEQGFLTKEEAETYRAQGYISYADYLAETGFVNREDARLFVSSGYETVNMALARGEFSNEEEARQLLLEGYFSWEDYEDTLIDELNLAVSNKSEDWEMIVELGDEIRDLPNKDSAYAMAAFINKMRIQNARAASENYSLSLDAECENLFRISAKFVTRVFIDSAESEMESYCGQWDASDAIKEQLFSENATEEDIEARRQQEIIDAQEAEDLERRRQAARERAGAERSARRVATLFCKLNGRALRVADCFSGDIETEIEITSNNRTYLISMLDLFNRRMPEISAQPWTSYAIDFSNIAQFSFTMPTGSSIRAQNSADSFILELEVKDGDGNIIYSDQASRFGTVGIRN